MKKLANEYPLTVTVATAIVIIVTVFGFGWKIRGSYAAIEYSLKELVENKNEMSETLENHETRISLLED